MRADRRAMRRQLSGNMPDLPGDDSDDDESVPPRYTDNEVDCEDDDDG